MRGVGTKMGTVVSRESVSRIHLRILEDLPQMAPTKPTKLLCAIALPPDDYGLCSNPNASAMAAAAPKTCSTARILRVNRKPPTTLRGPNGRRTHPSVRVG